MTEVIVHEVTFYLWGTVTFVSAIRNNFQKMYRNFSLLKSETS